jgi:hypothetical protein
MPTPLMKKAPECLGALSLNNYAFKFKAIKSADVRVLIWSEAYSNHSSRLLLKQ